MQTVIGSLMLYPTTTNLMPTHLVISRGNQHIFATKMMAASGKCSGQLPRHGPASFRLAASGATKQQVVVWISTDEVV